MKKLYFISGPMGVGKSTIGNILRANLKGMTPNQFGNHANPNLLPLVI